MEDLLTQPDVKHLMLIGAYRDNEVDADTSVDAQAAKPCARPERRCRTSCLRLLRVKTWSSLIADSLHCEPEARGPAGGTGSRRRPAAIHSSPSSFFPHFSKKDLLTFDHVAGRWSWDLASHSRQGDIPTTSWTSWSEKLNRLPLETQKALQQLACLGNSAEFAMLRAVYQDSSGGNACAALRKRSERVSSCARRILIASFTTAFRKRRIR